MPDVTTRGFPYAEDDDPVKTYPGTSEDLADFLEARVGLVQKGNTTIDIVTINVVASVVVTFATPFPVGVTPIIVATARTTNPQARFCSINSASNTGFTLYGLNSASNADFDAQWIAIG